MQIHTETDFSIYIAPINKLVLSQEISNELKVNQITFISLDKLKRIIRVRFKSPATISKLRKNFNGDFFNNRTFAICTYYVPSAKQEDEFLKEVNEALDIIALSQLIYGNRKSNAMLSITPGQKIKNVSWLSIAQDGRVHSSSSLLNSPLDLVLDKQWNDFQKFSFFKELQKILTTKKMIIKGKCIKENWIKKIKIAAVLAGKSQRTNNKGLSFLFNMIALEILLTKSGEEKSSTALPKRVEAFIGWSGNWSITDLHLAIEKLYKKRCAIVHEGDLNVSDDELLLSDYFIFNIFQNIIKHIALFYSQAALINFSNKIQAEKTLEITGKTRPKTLQDIRVSIQPSQLPTNIINFLKSLQQFT